MVTIRGGWDMNLLTYRVSCPHCTRLMDSFTLEPSIYRITCLYCSTRLHLLNDLKESDRFSLGSRFPEDFQRKYYMQLGYTVRHALQDRLLLVMQGLTIFFLSLIPVALWWSSIQTNSLTRILIFIIYSISILYYVRLKPQPVWVKTAEAQPERVDAGSLELGI